MKRKLLLVALAFGSVAGYSSAAFRHYHFHHGGHRHGFEQRVADICVAAAERYTSRQRSQSER